MPARACRLASCASSGARFAVAAMVRSDGHVNVDRDSARVGYGGPAVQLRDGQCDGNRVPKLDLATQAIVRTWSGANSDLIEQGGIGAENTFEIAAGAEYTPDPRRAYPAPAPLRALDTPSFRFHSLPDGDQGHEFGVLDRQRHAVRAAARRY